MHLIVPSGKLKQDKLAKFQKCNKNLHDLFGLIREVFLDLIVAELENLELIWERGLCGLSLSEKVDNLAIRERLLDVLVIEVDDCVAIREGLTLDSIIKDDLFLAVLVDALDLPIVTNVLLDDLLVRVRLVVVLLGELQAEIFLFVRDRGACSRLLDATLADVGVHVVVQLWFIAICIMHVSGIVIDGGCIDHWTFVSGPMAHRRAEVVIDLISLFLMKVFFVLIIIVCSSVGLNIFVRPVVILSVHVVATIVILIREEHLILEVIMVVVLSALTGPIVRRFALISRVGTLVVE